MTHLYPLDIAVHASNLAERLRTMPVLQGAAPPDGSLDPVDTWRIGRLADRLADKFLQEAAHRSAPARYTRQELVDVLSLARHHELGHVGGDEETAAFVADMHSAWLPTYRAALDRFEPASADGASWREFDVYCGRLAKVCEPFLVELGRRLEEVREPIVSPRVVDDLQRHLHRRFGLALAWATEADAKVHCAREGIDQATASREEYLEYLDSTFADGMSYHRFYLKFPVLGRWLAHVTALLVDFGQLFLRRLAADAAEVGQRFFGQTIEEFRSVEPGLSDFHAGARSVVRVEAALADGSTGTFYYKPRCIRSADALQHLLGRLAREQVVGFATRSVLPRDGYGYEAAIPSGRNEVGTIEQAEAIYRELGGYLAIFYVLGGGDLHFENILVADGHAFICDLETVLGVAPQGRTRSEGTLIDSVFRTGLLEWPRADGADEQMRISGYSGGEKYEMPVPVPRVRAGASFEASVVHESGIRVEPGGGNRVFHNGRLVQPQEHAEAIMAGFGRVYEWFQRQQDDAVEYLSAIFEGASARFINWGTQIYTQLLASAQHPRCLMDPMEVDLLTNTVRTFPRTWDNEGVLAEQEVEAMWRLDVPIFTADAHGTLLISDHRDQTRAFLASSPIDHAAERIKRLSEQNRAQQSQYVAASLSAGEISSPAFVSTSVSYADKIGSRLCELLREPTAASPWTSFQLGANGLEEADVETDLFLGSAGIGLFLAYLDHIEPRREFRRAAQRALDHALTGRGADRIGAYAGRGGLIYLLTHLHHLWREHDLLAEAVRLTDALAPEIERDRHFDVFHGVAGIIPVMLGLPGDRGLDLAHRCAEHLLRHGEERDGTLSWPSSTPEEVDSNLTGFSHGAAGIGWALISLGARTGRPDYVEAGRKAFAYEALHFDTDEQDWYDLRRSPGGFVRRQRHFANAWCNGAAGIGLSRIASWAALGRTDELLMREARQALSATVRNFPQLRNHTLCHGMSGNAELLLRFALLNSEPAFQLEANVQVQDLWRSLDDAELGNGEASASFFPGLMLGISGFGMHLLRLAHPDRVPSVLLLDSPPSR
ncbi:type 2 lanthipeptide synthetase LanM family protein [Saccharopolyspora taberi]|uniref:Type 2 lanthipeptide synthetase LanM family protein n=1 Tax=Saccharopolyspora taberi TaxID=60895 RepID=A0ABN3VI53_9PSEU